MLALPHDFRFLLAGLAALAGLLPACLAQANDSSAILAAGGLQFVQNRDVTMEHEDLHIGLQEISVRYRFRNTGEDDIETLVAFPLPTLSVGEEGNYVLDGADPINVLGFEVSADGKRVVPAVEVKATTRNGVDVTDVLKRHDIPPTMHAGNVDAYIAEIERLDQLPREARRELERYGLVDWATNYKTGGEPTANVHWDTHITFYWFQRFPAGGTVELSHRYRPVPRYFFFAEEDLAPDAELRRSYCIDKEFDRKARAMLARPDAEYGVLAGRELKYVLTTAGNWLGPIADFRLTVETASTDTLMSLCAPKARRTGPTTLEFSATDYSPEDDLEILFVQPIAE
jgi:hypothetical protein